MPSNDIYWLKTDIYGNLSDFSGAVVLNWRIIRIVSLHPPF